MVRHILTGTGFDGILFPYMKYILKQQKILETVKSMGINIPQLLRLKKKDDIWKKVRGILPKHPAGLKHQRKMRDEWI